MARIPLLGGAYKQASFIAGAQRCVNLYPEFNAERAQAPVQVTHYSRPGRTPIGVATERSPGPVLGLGRGLYADSLGNLYACISQNIYFIDSSFVFHLLFTLNNLRVSPVSFSDNGVTVFVVDGTAEGVQINIATKTASFITDPNFLGATRTDFLDSFNIFNQPGTPNWYCTESNSAVFNALFFGTKTAWPDNVVSIIASERNAWLMGQYKSEIWYNAGTVPFPFQLQSGLIIDHGLAGPYALARQDVNVYWLSQSPEGARLAIRGSALQAQRISTHAIEEEWLSYAGVGDCVVVCYQIRGHAFVEYHFPSADRTWVFDETTQEWHEEAIYDKNGVQHRMPDVFKAYAYGLNLALSWEFGFLLKIDEHNFTDGGDPYTGQIIGTDPLGVPILYKRSFPHLLDNEHFGRITLWRIIADMEAGTGEEINIGGSGGVTPPVPNPMDAFLSTYAAQPNPLFQMIDYGPSSLGSPSVPQTPPILIAPRVWLKISRDRGNSFYTHSVQDLGIPGGYNTRPTFYRCGYGFDIVPLLEWEGPIHVGLNSVFAEVEEHEGDW